MDRIERIRQRLNAAAPMHTPGEWYHDDIPYLLSELDRLCAERDAAVEAIQTVLHDEGEYCEEH